MGLPVITCEQYCINLVWSILENIYLTNSWKTYSNVVSYPMEIMSLHKC